MTHPGLMIPQDHLPTYRISSGTESICLLIVGRNHLRLPTKYLHCIALVSSWYLQNIIEEPRTKIAPKFKCEAWAEESFMDGSGTCGQLPRGRLYILTDQYANHVPVGRMGMGGSHWIPLSIQQISSLEYSLDLTFCIRSRLDYIQTFFVKIGPYFSASVAA